MEINKTITTSQGEINSVSWSQQLADWMARKWIGIFAIAMGLYIGLPFLAPFLLESGWSGAANAIYWIYSFQCHQLPQRSFFLFGPKVMYSLSEIQSAWQETTNPMVLRQFIGNPAMGWKVAWSDRMVYMYASTLFFGLLWWASRRGRKPLPWWGLVLSLLPMFVDGTTHFLSDLAGFGQGFRYTNLWLANLTQHAFSQTFYSGHALGSFNSWMRLISGVLFGLGVVWFGFPYVNEWFRETARLARGRDRHQETQPW